jgi:hypothetical protein
MRNFACLIWALAMAGSLYGGDVKLEELAKIAPGWKGEVVAKVDQSFCGWSVTIGDADNDGENEILTTGSPDSRLEYYKKANGQWKWKTLVNDLAGEMPGMGLTVGIVDLNGDGLNEIILGTGQDAALTCAKFYILQTDGAEITKKISSSSFLNGSAYTHNFGVYDIDGDGIKEVLTAYCGSGEVARYDVNKELTDIQRRHLLTHPGSGEDAMIADVDNDGAIEFISCDSFRKDAAKVKIFEFDKQGELIIPARVALAGYDGKPCFHCNIEVGDFDNDGKSELVVCWKQRELPNQGTIFAYDVSGSGGARPKYKLMYEDPDLDLSYCERMMIVADADNDGQNDLVVTTRGEKEWGGKGLAKVFLFKVDKSGSVKKTLLADFCDGQADSLWPAVGDADNDGKNEIVIATGIGSRRQSGNSYVIALSHSGAAEKAASENELDIQSSFTIDSRSEIIGGETPFPVEQTAASELQHYLEKMLGSSIAVKKDLKGNTSIVLGTPATSKVIDALKEQIGLSNIKNDGFIITPAEYEHKKILVVAANEPRGVLYGVYALLRKLGVNVRVDAETIPTAKKFQVQGTIQDDPFFKHRAGGIIDAIMKFSEEIPAEHLETMWRWYAQNGQNMFVYHSMAGNYPDSPELNAFLGTCLGSYIYFEDYPQLQWKQRNGKIIDKARTYLDYLIKSGQRWGVDIVLSVYEPGYPTGLLEAYPSIKGTHYPCPANGEFWTYLESEYRELFKAFSGLKGVIFTTGENSRGDIINATCALCCGTKWDDKNNWKIKQWQRPALVCQHIHDAVKSVNPDALVIFRPHLLDMTLGNIVSAVRWGPHESNPLMQKAIPEDVVIIRRPHDHDFISNAGHNQFLGAGLGPQPEGMLSLCGGEYRGKHSIPCAEIEEFGSGKARIPHFAAKGANFLNVNLSFYLPTWTGPSGCLGIDMMNEQQIARLVWSPFEDVNSIWMDWAKTYFPGAEKEMIEIMRPSYEMMYLMGYTPKDIYLQSTRFSFPRAFQNPRRVSQETIKIFEKAHQISATMIEKFLKLKDRISTDDYQKVKKYLTETEKFCRFWLNYVKANFYYYNTDQRQLAVALKTLSELTPTMDFPPCPWLDVWRDCITAPISYQENGTKFIFNTSSRLPDKPDYAYPIIDLYKYDDHHLKKGKSSEPPYITALLNDQGCGVDFNTLEITLNGKGVDSSKYTIVKNILLSNPSFERGLKEYPDEWIPENKNAAGCSYVKRGDNTEHSGDDCLQMEVVNQTASWKTDKQLIVAPNSPYVFSCWINPNCDENGKIFIKAIELDSKDAVITEHTVQASGHRSIWENAQCSFVTAASAKKVSLKLGLSGTGKATFDDVIFALNKELANLGSDLLVYSPNNLPVGLHEVSINIKDKAGNKAPVAKVSFEIEEKSR